MQSIWKYEYELTLTPWSQEVTWGLKYENPSSTISESSVPNRYRMLNGGKPILNAAHVLEPPFRRAKRGSPRTTEHLQCGDSGGRIQNRFARVEGLGVVFLMDEECHFLDHFLHFAWGIGNGFYYQMDSIWDFIV